MTTRFKKGKRGEVKLEGEDRERLAELVREAMEENQRLPDSTHLLDEKGVYKLELKEGGGKPFYVRQYPILERLKQLVGRRIQEWVWQKWIEEAAP